MKETTRRGFEKLAQIKNTGRFEKTIQIKKWRSRQPGQQQPFILCVLVVSY